MDGHCLTVPIQHHLNMLEGDDDVWDEVRVRLRPLPLLSLMLNTQNFMKRLIRMFAEADKGMVYFEMAQSLSKQKHTFIECVPLLWAVYDDIPAYFKVIDDSLSPSLFLSRLTKIGVHRWGYITVTSSRRCPLFDNGLRVTNTSDWPRLKTSAKSFAPAAVSSHSVVINPHLSQNVNAGSSHQLGPPNVIVASHHAS
jgi:hypothetical protein